MIITQVFIKLHWGFYDIKNNICNQGIRIHMYLITVINLITIVLVCLLVVPYSYFNIVNGDVKKHKTKFN
jgi:hypothetical protein